MIIDPVTLTEPEILTGYWLALCDTAEPYNLDYQTN